MLRLSSRGRSAWLCLLLAIPASVHQNRLRCVVLDAVVRGGYVSYILVASKDCLKEDHAITESTEITRVEAAWTHIQTTGLLPPGCSLDELRITVNALLLIAKIGGALPKLIDAALFEDPEKYGIPAEGLSFEHR